MNKIFIVLLLSLIVFSSCGEKKEYLITYKVYYPNTEKTYTIKGSGRYYPKTGAFRGYNTLFDGSNIVLETTAPIEILSIEEQ